MITKEQSGVSNVTTLQALECLEDMDDYARMECSIDPYGAYTTLKAYIEQTDALLKFIELNGKIWK